MKNTHRLRTTSEQNQKRNYKEKKKNDWLLIKNGGGGKEGVGRGRSIITINAVEVGDEVNQQK